MPIGPGKFGPHAERLLRLVGGELCLVMLYGDAGPGFDVAATNPIHLRLLPAILREMANSIEADLKDEGLV